MKGGRLANGDLVRASFYAFLNSLYACVETLEAEGKRRLRSEPGRPRVAAFEEWINETHTRRDTDDLLAWAHTTRGADVHLGEDVLNFSLFVLKCNLPPPALGTAHVIDNDGIYVVLDQGKPTEHRVPYHPSPGEELHVHLQGHVQVPSRHLGVELPPVALNTALDLLLDYHSRLLVGAVLKFG